MMLEEQLQHTNIRSTLIYQSQTRAHAYHSQVQN